MELSTGKRLLYDSGYTDTSCLSPRKSNLKIAHRKIKAPDEAVNGLLKPFAILQHSISAKNNKTFYVHFCSGLYHPT